MASRGSSTCTVATVLRSALQAAANVANCESMLPPLPSRSRAVSRGRRAASSFPKHTPSAAQNASQSAGDGNPPPPPPPPPPLPLPLPSLLPVTSTSMAALRAPA